MFNSVSRDALMESIRVSFPEFLPLAHILYGAPGLVHHHWGDGSWRIIEMLEGVNRGCPLSALFAALVLDRVIRPLDSMLRKWAQEQVAKGDYGDNGLGSITNIFAWVDDVCACIPLVDLQFFCTISPPSSSLAVSTSKSTKTGSSPPQLALPFLKSLHM